jgi:hypothetical protein
MKTVKPAVVEPSLLPSKKPSSPPSKRLPPGMKESQEKGPDGKFRRKATSEQSPHKKETMSHAQLLRAVEWVCRRLDLEEEAIKKWPIAGTKTMWRMAKTDPSWFYQNMVVKLLPKPEAERWDGKGICPLCKYDHTPVDEDEETKRARKVLNDWMRETDEKNEMNGYTGRIKNWSLTEQELRQRLDISAREVPPIRLLPVDARIVRIEWDNDGKAAVVTFRSEQFDVVTNRNDPVPELPTA